MFSKKNVLKNFAILIGKHLFQSLLAAEHLFKEHLKTLAQVFSSEFCEIFKNACFYRIPPVVASVNLLLTMVRFNH